jgi:hypothetical protein
MTRRTPGSVPVVLVRGRLREGQGDAMKITDEFDEATASEFEEAYEDRRQIRGAILHEPLALLSHGGQALGGAAPGDDGFC